MSESSTSSPGTMPSTPTATTRLRVAIQSKSEEESSAISEEVDLFLGVPYAQPPLGPLRAEKPVPPEKWEGVRAATSFGSASIPLSLLSGLNGVKHNHFSEDCLTLNIFRPTKPCPDPEGYSILVYIHGGGFCGGSAREYGHRHLCENFVLRSPGLIVVTIQYRLGVFGFITDGTDDLSGNFALWDQALALRFLHENAKAFGGNANRITAWGLSAGAASINTLAISPHCVDTIFSTIEMSGTVLTGWGAHDRAVKVGRELLEELCNQSDENSNQEKSLCNGHSHKSSKQIILTRTVDQIQQAVHRLGTQLCETNLLKYQPRVDGHFLPRDIPRLVSETRPRPCIMGVTANEAIYFTILGKDRIFNGLYIERNNFDAFDHTAFLTMIEKAVVPSNKFRSEVEAQNARNEICNFYTNQRHTENSPRTWKFYLDVYTQLLSDVLFNVPIVDMARRRARAGSSVYMYYNEYFNPAQFRDWVPIHGATHANEYPYMHGLFPVGKFHFSDTDEKHRSLLLEIISSFAMKGEPSIRPWPTVSPDDNDEVHFLRIDAESEVTVGSVPVLETSIRFWRKFNEKFSFNPIRDIPNDNTDIM
ncbi:carboxylesterase family domain-containing protein [Ditylenchus destructor]|uniref:Carboxylesterase family domain-containing protein n=1 Tax=Ditylenchus destructor TaxID=166010 RepID=A0AAD4R5G7_9BILA|nr:carboxylesterase family domain-containing protein [Ditylenchus destructor]